MDKENRREFAECMMVLNEVFANKEVTTELVEIYYRALIKYSIEEIKMATDRLVKTWSYNVLPKPSDFITAIEGTKDDKALNAWHQVIKAINTHGTYVNMVFDDPQIHVAVQAIGGLTSIGDCLSEKLIWKQKEFERAYKVSNAPIPKQLNGRFNETYSLDVTPPVYITTKKRKELSDGEER